MGRAPIYFSEIFRSGQQTYLIEVKRSQRGKKYMTITEIDNPPEYSRSVVVHEYCANRFWNLITDATHAMQNNVPEIDPAEWTWAPETNRRRRARSVERQSAKPTTPKKARPSNQGKRWTAAHDAVLTRRYDAGDSVEKIAQELGRTKRSVDVRLIKLGRIGGAS